MAMNRLLAINEDIATVGVIRETAESENFVVRTTRNGARFMALYDEFIPDAIALGLFMADMDGFELLKYLAERQCRAWIIIVDREIGNYGKMAEELATAYGLNVVTTLSAQELVRSLGAHLAALRAASAAKRSAARFH